MPEDAVSAAEPERLSIRLSLVSQMKSFHHHLISASSPSARRVEEPHLLYCEVYPETIRMLFQVPRPGVQLCWDVGRGRRA